MLKERCNRDDSFRHLLRISQASSRDEVIFVIWASECGIEEASRVAADLHRDCGVVAQRLRDYYAAQITCFSGHTEAERPAAIAGVTRNVE